MIRGPSIYGTFPLAWVERCTEIANARNRSNENCAANHDRGAKKNAQGHIVGLIGERLAEMHRPDLGVDSKRLYASGVEAHKVDGTSGVDIKSSPIGRPRVLINRRQASSPGLVGVVVVLVSLDPPSFWMSPVIPVEEIRSWDVFDGPYGDPAYSMSQRALVAAFPVPR